MTRAQQQQQQALSARNENRGTTARTVGASLQRKTDSSSSIIAPNRDCPGAQIYGGHIAAAVCKNRLMWYHTKKNENQVDKENVYKARGVKILVLKQTK